jgi:hypothetical protein
MSGRKANAPEAEAPSRVDAVSGPFSNSDDALAKSSAWLAKLSAMVASGVGADASTPAESATQRPEFARSSAAFASSSIKSATLARHFARLSVKFASRADKTANALDAFPRACAGVA